MMPIIVALPFLLLLGFLIYIIVRKSGKSGVKVMLLGLSIILFGAIFIVDGGIDLEGFEYLIIFIGLIFSFIGFGKDN